MKKYMVLGTRRVKQSRHLHLSLHIEALELVIIPSSPHIGFRSLKNCELHSLYRRWDLAKHLASLGASRCTYFSLYIKALVHGKIPTSLLEPRRASRHKYLFPYTMDLELGKISELYLLYRWDLEERRYESSYCGVLRRNHKL